MIRRLIITDNCHIIRDKYLFWTILSSKAHQHDNGAPITLSTSSCLLPTVQTAEHTQTHIPWNSSKPCRRHVSSIAWAIFECHTLMKYYMHWGLESPSFYRHSHPFPAERLLFANLVWFHRINHLFLPVTSPDHYLRCLPVHLDCVTRYMLALAGSSHHYAPH